MQTQLYVAKTSKTLDVEQIHYVLAVLQESDEPKKTLQGAAIALLYYGLLQIDEAKKLNIKNITALC